MLVQGWVMNNNLYSRTASVTKKGDAETNLQTTSY